MTCRYHGTEYAMDLNGVEFCRECRKDPKAIKEQIAHGEIDKGDPQEETDALNTLLESQR